jgi:regulator of sigma E protease
MAVQKKINWMRLIIAIVLVAAGGYWIANNPLTFFNIMLVILGFGAVVVVHEFGHFIVAKLSGIKVEAFSIGFPPTLVAFTRKKDGFRLSILPKLFEADEGDGGNKTDSPLAKAADPQAWDTEYRIGLIPFGGFVKMLGQEDTGAVQQTVDPRSFTNKSIFVRIAVVAAGVIFNAISAFLIFMVVFMMGMKLPPAVVGSVMSGSPAERQGLRPGDEIVEVNGDTFVDFTALVLAPALSSKGQPIHFKVKRPDGRIDAIDVVAEDAVLSDIPGRSLGIQQGQTLTIERKITPGEAEVLMQKTGLAPHDEIIAAGGKPVANAWDMEEIIRGTFADSIALTLARGKNPDGKGSVEKVEVRIPLQWPQTNANFSTEFDLCHVGSLVPRLKIITDLDTRTTPKGWISKFFGPKPADAEKPAPLLRKGDIILKAGDVEVPTYEELRRVTIDNKNKPMPMTVLRKDDDGKEESVAVEIVPRALPNTDRVTIGIAVALDAEHPVVAGIVGTDPPTRDIPRGATITAIDGQEVRSFYDIARLIDGNAGEKISVEYRLNEQNAGSVGLDIPKEGAVNVRPVFAAPVPLETLKRVFKAPNAVAAIGWGMKKTWQFIAQSVVTLHRLISQDVSPKSLMGPVGIVSVSYSIASRSLVDYIYFLGLISSCIAVMNLLPLPIVDGGVIVLLLVEKLRGKPLSEKVQEIISYAGIAFLLAVFLWLTYNDILRILFG